MNRTKLPIEALAGWIFLNDVDFIDVTVGEVADRGLGLVSEKKLSRNEDTFDIPTLIKIPYDLVLSAEAVEEYAKVNKNFRELLEATGRQSTRGDILLYLLTQLVLSSRSPGSTIGGVSTPWTEYVKFLPDRVPVPTLWTAQERLLLKGTSLEPAVAAKIQALTNEYDQLRESSSSLPFWNSLFWDGERVSLDDWFLVDAWYRSRCLELPRSGESMVPCLDMANHSASPTAYYEENDRDEVVLLLRPNCTVSSGEEITISYGESKSGAEMLFSYGFVGPTNLAQHATFPLSPLPDDPLGKAKLRIFDGPTTLHVSRTNGTTAIWNCPFAYLMCLNEEDGLAFRVLQETGGSRELKVFWQEEDVTTATADFETLIKGHPLSEVFRLRVVMVVRERVVSQLEAVRPGISLEDLEALSGGGVIRDECISNSDLLRESEASLLESVLQALEEQKAQLLTDENVVAYLGSMEATQSELVEDSLSNKDDDFS